MLGIQRHINESNWFSPMSDYTPFAGHVMLHEKL